MNYKKYSYNARRKNISLSVILVLFFIVYTFSGSTDPKSMYISLSLLILWGIVALFSNEMLFLKALTEEHKIYLYMYLAFLFMTSVFVAGPFQTVKLIGLNLVIFSPIIIFDYYKNFYVGKLKTIIYISISAIIFFAIKALSFYSVNRDAARRLAANENVFGDIAIGGGYPFAFAATILLVYLVELLINKVIVKKTHRIAMLGLTLLLFILILETKSTIILISLFFGIGLSIINRNPVKVINRKIFVNPHTKIRVNQVIKILLLLLLTIVVILNIKNLGYLVLSNTNGTDVVSKRLHELGIVLYNGLNESDYVLYRLDRPIFSILKFFESPLIGQGYKYGYIYKDSLPYIGGHSEWLDSLANYGIFGAAPFFALIFLTIRKNKRKILNVISGAYFWTFIIMGFLNPLIVFHSTFMIFLLIPIINEVINTNVQASYKMERNFNNNEELS